MKNETLEKFYSRLYEAFNHFNKELFDGSLPETILSFTPLSGAYGYFQNDSFIDVKGKKTIHHISLNPRTMKGRSTRDILSTLGHEMVHLHHQIVGKPGKNRYHNKEWAGLMKAIDLMPTDTGKKGGKETGLRVTHYIKPQGKFDKSCKRLLDSGFEMDYIGVPETKKKNRAKTKYTCEETGVSVWGKPGLNIVCGDTGMEFVEQIGLKRLKY